MNLSLNVWSESQGMNQPPAWYWEVWDEDVRPEPERPIAGGIEFSQRAAIRVARNARKLLKESCN